MARRVALALGDARVDGVAGQGLAASGNEFLADGPLFLLQQQEVERVERGGGRVGRRLHCSGIVRDLPEEGERALLVARFQAAEPGFDVRAGGGGRPRRTRGAGQECRLGVRSLLPAVQRLRARRRGIPAGAPAAPAATNAAGSVRMRVCAVNPAPLGKTGPGPTSNHWSGVALSPPPVTLSSSSGMLYFFDGGIMGASTADGRSAVGARHKGETA